MIFYLLFVFTVLFFTALSGAEDLELAPLWLVVMAILVGVASLTGMVAVSSYALSKLFVPEYPSRVIALVLSTITTVLASWVVWKMRGKHD